MKFKLRAECLKDVLTFIKSNADIISLNVIKDDSFPDVEFEFESNLGKEDLIEILRSQADSDVMIQTLDFFENYTGNRNYEL